MSTHLTPKVLFRRWWSKSSWTRPSRSSPLFVRQFNPTPRPSTPSCLSMRPAVPLGFVSSSLVYLHIHDRSLTFSVTWPLLEFSRTALLSISRWRNSSNKMRRTRHFSCSRLLFAPISLNSPHPLRIGPDSRSMPSPLAASSLTLLLVLIRRALKPSSRSGFFYPLLAAHSHLQEMQRRGVRPSTATRALLAESGATMLPTVSSSNQKNQFRNLVQYFL